MHVASNPHALRFQNSRSPFPIFMLSNVLRTPQRTAVLYSPHMAAKNRTKKRKATLDSVLSTVERGALGGLDEQFSAV
jgi:hypothetical protein